MGAEEGSQASEEQVKSKARSGWGMGMGAKEGRRLEAAMGESWRLTSEEERAVNTGREQLGTSRGHPAGTRLSSQHRFVTLSSNAQQFRSSQRKWRRWGLTWAGGLGLAGVL